LNAPSTDLTVPGRVPVAGRAKPVTGRPPAVTGRTPALGWPARVEVLGRMREVPGRGICAVAFSSNRTSATPWDRGER